MRKLMWFTLGTGIACGIGAYFAPGLLLLLLAAAALFGTAGMWLLMQHEKRFQIGCAIFLGLAFGFLLFFCFDAGYLSDAVEMDGKTVFLDVRITDYSWETEYGVAGDGTTVLNGKTYRLRLYLSDSVSLVPGDRVCGQFELQATTGGRKNTFHRGQGIYLLAYSRGKPDYQLSEYLEIRDLPTYWRHSLIQKIDQLFPEKTAPFARALLLGDDSDLSYETETALRVSGLWHIVAVSGLHISVLFSLLFFLTGKKPLLATVAVIPFLLLFSAIVGFTPSVMRACVMQCIVILAMLFRRDYDSPTALACSVLMMLCSNPMVITSVSFQLSVSCIAGILLFAMPIKRWMMDKKRLGRFRTSGYRWKLCNRFAGSVSISLGTMVLTAPLTAVYFGSVSLSGLLCNLLALWAVNLVFPGILIACAGGFLWPTAGTALAGILSLGIQYIMEVAEFADTIHFGAVYTVAPGMILWIVLAYLLLCFCMLKKFRWKKEIGMGIVAAFCICCLISWIAPLQGECRMTALDVGQGQCILLQSEGRTFMVDCGGSYSEDAADLAAETLLSQGIGKLDGLILTHYDQDHAGGVEPLLSRISVSMLLLPDVTDEKGVREEICRKSDGKEILVSQDVEITYGSTKITVFAPLEGETGNESSMCVLFQTENCDILITGDNSQKGERLLLERTTLPKLEVLIVGHHGSKYSTAPELLAATRPEVAVISVDGDNSYGHPTQEVLDRLTEAGCVIYRTDLDGTVVFQR